MTLFIKKSIINLSFIASPAYIFIILFLKKALANKKFKINKQSLK